MAIRRLKSTMEASITTTVTKTTLGILGCLFLCFGCQNNRVETTYSQTEMGKLIEENPKDPHYYNELGKLYLDEGKIDEARKAFEKALKINPNCPKAQAGLGYVALEKKQYDRAEAIFKKVLREDPNNQMATKGLQRLAFERHQSS